MNSNNTRERLHLIYPFIYLSVCFIYDLFIYIFDYVTFYRSHEHTHTVVELSEQGRMGFRLYGPR